MAALGETIEKLQAELQQAQEQIERLTSQLQVCREAANDSEMRWQGERRAFERVIRILNGDGAMSDSDRVKMIKEIANEFMAAVIAATEAEEAEMRAKLIANRTGEAKQ